jgi:hypothetical protein
MTPVCKTGEVLRSWTEGGLTACVVEEFNGTCNANTFAVLNATCSSGFATGASAIWQDPFNAADNGPFYFFARDQDTWTIIPYNHTGTVADFRFFLTCCS